MRRLVVTLALLTAASACAPAHDVEVSWTIGGLTPSAEVCGDVVETVRVIAYSSADRDGDRTESTGSFACADGLGVVQVGNFADIKVELLRGETVVGGAPLFSVAPTSGFLTEPDAVAVDTNVSIGTLSAELTIGGMSCGEAGVSSISVSLYRELTGLDIESVDDATVSCNDDATYSFDGVHVNATYIVVARATKADTTYATGGSGARVTIDRAATGAIVNLIRERETAEPE